jgi:hypothetical protein
MPNPHSQSVSHVSTHARALLRIIVLHTHITDTPGQPRSTGLAQTDTQAARNATQETTRASSKSQGEAATRTAEILGILAWTATPQIPTSEGPPSCAAGVPFCRASTHGQLQTQQQQGHRTRTAR